MTTDRLNSFVGRICSFHRDASASVVLCLPVKPFVVFLGTVKAATAKEPARGGIPDVVLTVEGRTGKLAKVSLVDHYVRFHDSWLEAERNLP